MYFKRYKINELSNDILKIPEKGLLEKKSIKEHYFSFLSKTTSENCISILFFTGINQNISRGLTIDKNGDKSVVDNSKRQWVSTNDCHAIYLDLKEEYIYTDNKNISTDFLKVFINSFTGNKSKMYLDYIHDVSKLKRLKRIIEITIKKKTMTFGKQLELTENKEYIDENKNDYLYKLANEINETNKKNYKFDNIINDDKISISIIRLMDNNENVIIKGKDKDGNDLIFESNIASSGFEFIFYDKDTKSHDIEKFFNGIEGFIKENIW